MPAKKPDNEVRLTKSTTLVPDTVDDLEILCLLQGHRSLSATIASIVEAHLEANPVDDLTRARYRRAKKQRGHVTPVDLLTPASEATPTRPAARQGGIAPMGVDVPTGTGTQGLSTLTLASIGGRKRPRSCPNRPDGQKTFAFPSSLVA